MVEGTGGRSPQALQALDDLDDALEDLDNAPGHVPVHGAGLHLFILPWLCAS